MKSRVKTGGTPPAAHPSGDDTGGTCGGGAPGGGTALGLRDVRVTLPSAQGDLRILRGVSFSVARGEIVAVAGESGSGKSTSILAALRLLPAGARVDGSIECAGADVLGMGGRELRRLRARGARLIFQDPWRALHPMKRIGAQLVESARTADPDLSRAKARALAEETLGRVGIPDPASRMRSHPHEISGGQAQRIVIAMALVARPAVLLCDEPTTALDVTTQAQILELLRDLNRELGLSIVIATHDLDVIADIADRLVVMYAGEVVESGPTAEMLARPRHPYTYALLRAAPGLAGGGRLHAIAGRPPSPAERPAGCAFAARCPSVHDRCATVRPEPREVLPGRTVACLRAEGYGAVTGGDA
ncbi:ABC transporter ATP-binding protein [Actinomadura algeriensis]|uniref:Oligopeptide/dipeptide ABC transporter ATP-binding protein n=1 Tax=Actinomadura algeriensis TaxID=1679523 RepID=A0ABR9K145_9ACTN|nr:ABC transporter ATP-binding protein [Actinomadura algeriensis]MBE1536561.1 oligopeptide/dipeptide ABC transporter ATP-binding protein [Actinomadura algeriensis]